MDLVILGLFGLVMVAAFYARRLVRAGASERPVGKAEGERDPVPPTAPSAADAQIDASLKSDGLPAWLVLARHLVGQMIVTLVNPMAAIGPLPWLEVAGGALITSWGIAVIAAAVAALYLTDTQAPEFRRNVIRVSWVLVVLTTLGAWGSS